MFCRYCGKEVDRFLIQSQVCGSCLFDFQLELNEIMEQTRRHDFHITDSNV
jgi:NMD protein affecting ribosome stability and mRNA decay